MTYDQLIEEMRRQDGFADDDHAEAALMATLSVLTERLTGEEPRHLAAQLPGRAAEAVRAPGKGESFDAEEFARRVADREARGCSPEDAKRHARAAFYGIKQAVTEGEWRDVVSQLPEDYSPMLFGGKDISSN